MLSFILNLALLSVAITLVCGQTEGDSGYDYNDAYDEDYADDADPEFDMPEVNVTVVVGQRALLPCAIRGLGKYKVSWFASDGIVLTYENRRVVDDTRFRIVRPYIQEWNLQIWDVVLKDEGTYRCAVNTDPTRSKQVMLHVKEPPGIIDDLSSGDTVVYEGDNVTLVCNVTGTPQPQVNWFKHRATSQQPKLEKIAGGEGEVLVLPSVTREDDGYYTCVAASVIPPPVSRQIRLTVKAVGVEPTFDVPEVNVTVLAGRTAVLPCDIMDLGKYRVTWIHPNYVALTSGEQRIDHDTRFSISHSYDSEWNLQIQNVTREDGGTYRCLVNTEPIRSKKVVLHVRAPPGVTYMGDLYNGDIEVQEGDNVTLVCNITGIPQTQVKWFRYFSHKQPHEHHIAGVEGEVLVLPSVTREDDDHYSCRAYNGITPIANRHFRIIVSYVTTTTHEIWTTDVTTMASELSSDKLLCDKVTLAVVIAGVVIVVLLMIIILMLVVKRRKQCNNGDKWRWYYLKDT